MGFFDKFRFGKKDDLPDFGSAGLPGDPPAGKQHPQNDPFANLGSGSAGDDIFSQQKAPPVNEFGLGNMPNAQRPFESARELPSSDPYGPASTGSSHGGIGSRDIDLLTSKLDLIRSTVENLAHKMESLDRRLAAIEQIARKEQEQAAQQRW